MEAVETFARGLLLDLASHLRHDGLRLVQAAGPGSRGRHGGVGLNEFETAIAPRRL
jgi:hypothetical protein